MLHKKSSISIQRRLATVGFTDTNGIQSHHPTQSIIANRLLMISMTNTICLIMVSTETQSGKVAQRFNAQFSFSLPISELVTHISVLVLLCLTL